MALFPVSPGRHRRRPGRILQPGRQKKLSSPGRRSEFSSACSSALRFILKGFTFEIALSRSPFLGGLVYLSSVDTVEKVWPVPAVFRRDVFGAVYLGFTLNYFYFSASSSGLWLSIFSLP